MNFSDPYYSPTEEEIAESIRKAKRKFSNRFVPMERFAQLAEALIEIQQIASGEKQVAMDDTEGMAVIDKIANAALEGRKL